MCVLHTIHSASIALFQQHTRFSYFPKRVMIKGKPLRSRAPFYVCGSHLSHDFNFPIKAKRQDPECILPTASGVFTKQRSTDITSVYSLCLICKLILSIKFPVILVILDGAIANHSCHQTDPRTQVAAASSLVSSCFDWEEANLTLLLPLGYKFTRNWPPSISAACRQLQRFGSIFHFKFIFYFKYQ